MTFTKIPPLVKFPALFYPENTKVAKTIDAAQNIAGEIKCAPAYLLLQSWINWLAFQRQHAEDTFMNAVKRLSPDETIQCLHAKYKLIKINRVDIEQKNKR